ncbi:hypothetical protein pdul_cds_117 [Pandoravirus dulcis]|uniref:Uncharacterized protein n=1 Tax=Pandoravirus dulcis TaxID=1349409 RepID=S4VVQ5_9VIRU|nr:hypothetical protein pdul_cds_117 [Pandoravirus dulcis]AGO82024.2 hypothetical protein pdul_cds_117 [Pandoravirus dulcis]
MSLPHEKTPLLQGKTANRQASHDMAFFSKKGVSLSDRDRTAFLEQEAAMIARLKAISEIAPLTDDGSDALTREWNADFDEADRPRAQERRRLL